MSMPLAGFLPLSRDWRRRGTILYQAGGPHPKVGSDADLGSDPVIRHHRHRLLCRALASLFIRHAYNLDLVRVDGDLLVLHLEIHVFYEKSPNVVTEAIGVERALNDCDWRWRFVLQCGTRSDLP